jgi:hypothetical protein
VLTTKRLSITNKYFRKESQIHIREPFEKFVDWRQYAVVMQRGHKSVTVAHCRQSTNFSNGLVIVPPS